MKALSAFRRLVATGLVLLLAACAAPASREAMTVDAIAVSQPYRASVAVSVSGGTDAMEGAAISNAEMKAAIEESIRRTHLFEKTQASDGDYALSVFITSVQRPAFGISMTVSMEAGWTLTRKSDGAIVLRKVVGSTFTGTPTDAFSGAKRVGIAVEGAARENVRQGLEAVAAASR